MPQQIIASSAAIATGHPLGTSAGLEILRAGGNAVDGAVAAMIALSVVIPGSVGLGGYGGSAIIRSSAGGTPRIAAVDFDSCAPLGFRDGLVTAEPESNYYGARAVTVPAVVAGLDVVLREFGTKSWREVSGPAIRLAEVGFEFDAEHQKHLDRCAPKFKPESLKSLFAGSALPRSGERWQQPDLAKLLRRLAEDGPSSFYEGDIAERIVRYLAERGGILSDDDFRTYRAHVVDPLSAQFRGYALYTPPLPSGGATSLAIVQTVERLGLEQLSPWGGEYFHYLAEATKLCWQERADHFGDPDFVRVEIERFTSEPAADERAAKIRSGSASRGVFPANDSPHTANVIAADDDGNLISLTATQGWMYGSHLVVDGLGLVLNHGMSRFDFTPGHPNSPAAGKRMQHNMAPLIALADDRPEFAYGLPGGPKIVNVTAQLVLDTIAFGATPAASIAAARLHTQGNEPIHVSTHFPNSVAVELETLGHKIRRTDDMGGPVNVLAIDRRSKSIDIASGESTGAVGGI